MHGGKERGFGVVLGLELNFFLLWRILENNDEFNKNQGFGGLAAPCDSEDVLDEALHWCSMKSLLGRIVRKYNGIDDIVVGGV